jgi:hypothetical protein
MILGFLAASAAASAAEPLIEQTLRAVGEGHFKEAYTLLTRRSARNPESVVKPAAPLLQVKAPIPAIPQASVTAHAGPDPEAAALAFEAASSGGFPGKISDSDLDEARQFAAPVRLKPFQGGPRSFHLRGDVKTLYETVAGEFGYVVVLDKDLKAAPATTLRFDIENANYEDALHLLEAATDTFIVPVSGSVFFAAIDTQQKRNELEPAAAQVFLIPDRTSVQEAQELLQAVQQSLEIKRAVLDQGKRMILMRGPYSRVRVAEAILRQLLGPKPQVMVEVELITFDKSKSKTWGLGLMNSSNLVNFSSTLSSSVLWENVSTITNFLTFGGGATFLGVGFTGAQLFASATESEATSLMRSSITVSDGQAANFHIGDKYPIPTQEFSGVTPGSVGAVPTVNFEDLGIVMKITPAIHSSDEVSLDLEAEYKALGTTTTNGIPSITDTKLQAKMRLNTSEWAVVAGLVSSSDTTMLNGLPGLLNAPVVGGLFRSNSKQSDYSETLILIKINVMQMPSAEERVSKALWVGSDTRWRTVL